MGAGAGGCFLNSSSVEALATAFPWGSCKGLGIYRKLPHDGRD
jgi:hypothetical protein